ncbi:MAG: gfo/Idh/MocA family oxidoreductase [Candidatus Pacebacteria bacterium]|nr:gfo/Idh/MocA family oxidoreductase [Candidatus Paceibacterota bacterium]
MKQINFAIIGFGRIGKRFKQKITENKNAKLMAICDVKKASLDKLSKKYFITDRYQDILKRKDVEVVYVATPNSSHAQIALAALKANKHVICEKPMALTVLDANKMILASQKSKGTLFIVKQNRFNPPVEKVKKLIDANKLGQIYLVTVNCFWNRNPDYYLHSDWKGKKNLDGGTLYTQFSHFIDIVYYLLGDFTEVFAQGKNFNHQKTIEFEDSGIVSFKLSNGALGSLNYSTAVYDSNMEGSITIIAEKGSIKIGGEYLNTLAFFKVKGQRKPRLNKGAKANDYGSYKGSMSNHDKVLNNVINTLQGKETVSTSGFEGMKTIQIIESIYDSMQMGQAVKIK